MYGIQYLQYYAHDVVILQLETRDNNLDFNSFFYYQFSQFSQFAQIS